MITIHIPVPLLTFLLGLIVGTGIMIGIALLFARAAKRESLSRLSTLDAPLELQFVADDEEQDAVIERYHAKPYHFPKMRTKDPVSIILGAKPGDVVRFNSDSETSGLSVTYRYVV